MESRDAHRLYRRYISFIIIIIGIWDINSFFPTLVRPQEKKNLFIAKLYDIRRL